MNKLKVITLALLLPCLASAGGVNATWIDTSTDAGNWLTIANWSGTDRAPTNVADKASFSSAVGAKTVLLPHLRNCSGLTSSIYLMGLDEVSGLAGYTIDVGAKLLSTYSASQQHDKLLQVRETSDFYGVWRARTAGWPGAAAFSGLALVPNAGDVPVVRNVDVAHGFRIIVPNRTASAKVGSLTTGGRLEANYGLNFTAGGHIEIERPAGGRTDLLNAFGSITFKGTVRPADASVPVPGAWLHLDANARETLSTDGAYVSRWNDVSGNGRYAAAPSDARRPFVRPGAANGRNAVDFGAFGDVAASVSKYGASACMTWSEACTGVREVYFVFEDVESGNAAQQLVGSANAQSAFTRPAAKSSGLFSSDYALPVAQGEIRVDGGRVRATENEDFSKRWHVLSVRTTEAVGINSFAQLGNGTSVGGIRLAEVLVYDKVLTDTERLQNETYLARKWLPEGARDLWDYGWVKLATNAVEVASGAVAIRHLELPANATELVKTGAGDLTVEWLPPSVTKVTVKEGNFAFAGSTRVDDSEPKDTPLVHLDANDVEGATGAEVATWADKRPTSAFKGIPGWTTTRASPKPTKAEGPNGNTVIDFGERVLAGSWNGSASSSSAYMKVNNGSSEMGKVVREAFMVVAFNTTGTRSDAVLCGSSSTLLEPAVNDLGWLPILDTQGADPIGQASAFWVDGCPIDPRTYSKEAFKDVTYHVLNYRLLTRGEINYLAAARNADTGAVGGLRIGEVVYYDHVLSDADRRDTCAYLMRKWLDKDHPDAGAQSHVTKIVYENANAKTVLHASEDASLAAVEIPETGAFEKTGAGTLAVSRLAPETKAIAVSGGSLDVTLDLFAGAAFHVDATDADSITTNAEGKITKWSDTDGGSVYASQYKPYGRTDLIALATMKSVQTAEGADSKTIVDFGEYFKEVGSSWPQWEGKDAAAMSWSAKPLIREAHIVRSDTSWDSGTSGYRYPVMFGFSAVGAATLSDSYPFMRLDQELFQNASYGGKQFNKGLADGEIYIDGVSRKYTYKPATKQFYLASFVPSNALENVNMFAGSAQGQIGGQQIGESVVFTRTNTVARRTAIMRHLTHKWTDATATNPWNVNLDSVAVTSGGTLKLRTSDCEPVCSSGDFAFAFDAQGNCSKMVVDGTVSLPSTGTLAVALPAGVVPAPGRYPLIFAMVLSGGANLENWQVTLPTSKRRSFRLECDETGVYLAVERFGLMLIVQ